MSYIEAEQWFFSFGSSPERLVLQLKICCRSLQASYTPLVGAVQLALCSNRSAGKERPPGEGLGGGEAELKDLQRGG